MMAQQGLLPVPGMGGGLNAAVSLLLCADAESDLGNVLAALEEVASSLLAMATCSSGDGAELQPELCNTCVEALARGLAAARSGAAATAAQLDVMRSGLWCQTMLPLVDLLFHSTRWYETCQQESEAMQGFFRVRESAREMVKSSFLPLLGEAAVQQAPGTGFRLGDVFHKVLDIARKAASILGMQDDRATTCPHMRYYGLVGVLWNGLAKLWTSVPAGLRPELEASGLGAQTLLESIAGYLCSDLSSLSVRLEATDVKLLLFWAQHLFRLLQAFPEAAPTAWPLLLRYACHARQQQDLLRGMADERAAVVVEAMEQSQLVAKAGKLLACCLNAMRSDQDIRAAVDGLRCQLVGCTPTRHNQAAQAARALSAVLSMLQQAAAMRPQVRHMCLPLLDAATGAMAGPLYLSALEDAGLREELAGSMIAFMAACCLAAAQGAAAGVASATGRDELQLQQQSWARCQQQLFLLTLQPHPLVAQVLGQVWADLAAASEEALARHHIMLLNSLLQTTVAAEAAAAAASGASLPPPSPLQLQLVSLLACVLTAVSEQVREGYLANFLVVSDAQDSCKLAVLAAELQLAAVVDGALGGHGAAGLVQAALQQLAGALEGSMDALPAALAASGPWGTEAAVWVAQLLHTLECAVSYLGETGTAQPLLPLLSSLASGTVGLLGTSPASSSLRFAAPALGLLAGMHGISEPLLSDGSLQALLPLLLPWAGRPELAGPVARLAAAYKSCTAPHAQLFHKLMAAADPLVHHAAMEAYTVYVRGCPSANVRSAVPPALQNPASGAPSASFLALMKQYMSRAVPLDAEPISKEAMEGWSAALQDGADGAVASLLRAVEVAQSAQPPEAPGAAPPAVAAPARALLQRPGPAAAAAAHQPATAGPSGEDEADDVGSAVQEVAAAIKQVAAALKRAGGGPDAATSKMLRKCAGRLEQLAQD